MFWVGGGIGSEVKTDLHMFQTTHKYISDILKAYVLPFTPYICNYLIFMHDNM